MELHAKPHGTDHVELVVSEGENADDGPLLQGGAGRLRGLAERIFQWQEQFFLPLTGKKLLLTVGKSVVPAFSFFPWPLNQVSTPPINRLGARLRTRDGR